MKKVLLVLFILLITTTIVSAETIYVLEEGEIVLDGRELNENKLEIFTQIDGNYYKKTLEKVKNTWKLVDSKEAKIHSTGLKKNQKIVNNYAIEEPLENKLKANGYSINALPSKLDLSDSGLLPPIGEQNENSCVGWAVGYYLRTYQQAKDIGWYVGNDPKHIFSPSFIYNQINEGVDQGSTLYDAGELLKNTGAATIYDFPYNPGDYYTLPSHDVIQKAAPHKIRDWYVLYTYNDSPDYIINKTKEYLNTGDLPIVGIEVGFKWMEPTIQSDGTSIVTTEQYTPWRHAVAVVGYNDNLPTPEGYGAFKIINSYGEEWGQYGYTYMTYNAFTSAVREGFVFTDLVNGEIVDYMNKVIPSLVNDNTVKFDWDDIVNASGYKVLDENFKVITNVADSEYTEDLGENTKIKRYFQAFNSISTSNVVSAEVDLNDTLEETIPVEINDTVHFQMNFSGKGRYDIRIKDMADTLIKEDLNLTGIQGLNIYKWNGKDNEGNIVANGNYKLELTPYRGTKPKSPVLLNFTKEEKVVSASAKQYSLNGIKYKVEITITVSKSGELSITSGDSTILTEMITKGQTKTYKLNPADIDKNIEISIR